MTWKDVQITSPFHIDPHRHSVPIVDIPDNPHFSDTALIRPMPLSVLHARRVQASSFHTSTHPTTTMFFTMKQS